MPNVDGKGQDGPKETTPEKSVDVQVRSNVPGGESKSGSQIQTTGPNSGKK